MSSDIEKSFLANLFMLDDKVNLLESLYGKPVMAKIGEFGGGWAGKPQTRDHSSLMGIRPKDECGSIKSLRLHFRYTASGYIISIKNRGEYYNKIISESWLEFLGAKDCNIDEPSIYSLVDFHNKPVTLENLPDIHNRVCIMTEDNRYWGAIRSRSLSYTYIGKTEERSKIPFVLSILERQVPHTRP